MRAQHYYKVTTRWTGNKGTGTDNYRNYERSHTIAIENKPDMLCSSDPAFRGDRIKYNPEDLLVSSISSCHMLWYLHLCSEAGVVVLDYTDNATGIMDEKANELHKKANEFCFIANSLNFPVKHNPTAKTK